jgi:thiaminase
MKDNIGITTIKIQNLYKDKTLTGKELRKRTKEILNEFKNEELEHNRQYIKKLQISADELQTIKRILS